MAFEDSGHSGYWTRRIRRRGVMRGGLAGGAALMLAACGTKTKSSTSSSKSPAAAAGGPRSGGTLTMAITADPYDWDSSYAGPGLPNSTGYHLAYNNVLTWKHGSDVPYDQMVLQPELASSWEVPDAQTFIFHVRPGVKFANVAPANGRPLVAGDIKFNFEYASRSGSVAPKNLPVGQYSSYFEGLTSIETPDDSTVTVKFKAPFVPFINYMASTFVPIMPHEIYDQAGDFKSTVVGTGPFVFDSGSSTPGSKWVWKKNPTYWDAGKPYIDQINWLIVKDDASAQAALQTKQLDLLDTDLDLTSVSTLMKASPSIVLFEANAVVPYHLYMNSRQGMPLADIRLRQAIALTIDRDEFLKTLFDGKGTWPMAGAFPDTYSQDEIKALLKHDPAQAKQLVSAAGYTNGVDLQFNYPGDAYGQIYITQMQLLQAQLKQVGINLQLNSLDKDTESTRKKQGQFVITDTPKSVDADVDSYLYQVFYPGSRANYTGVDDPQLTPLLVQQRQETDASKRNDILRQAVKRINVDQVWALGVFNGLVWNLMQPRVQNYAPHFGLTLTLDSAWLKD